MLHYIGRLKTHQTRRANHIAAISSHSLLVIVRQLNRQNMEEIGQTVPFSSMIRFLYVQVCTCTCGCAYLSSVRFFSSIVTHFSLTLFLSRNYTFINQQNGSNDFYLKNFIHKIHPVSYTHLTLPTILRV